MRRCLQGRWGVAIGVVALGLLLLPLPGGPEGRLLDALEDLAHFPVFLVLGLLLGARGRGRLGRGALLIVALAVGVELLQPWTGREMDGWDALVSTLGGVAGLLLARAGRAESQIRPLDALVALVGFACIAVWPVGGVLLDQYRARRDFPVLASFERAAELDRWVIRGATAFIDPEGGLQVEIEPGTAYPGLFMTEPVPDWRGFSRICFDLQWPQSASRDMWIRVDDRREEPPYIERGQVLFTLTSGWNRVCVALDALLRTPSGRRMDAAQITRWGIFLDAAQGGDTFVLDHVRLSVE